MVVELITAEKEEKILEKLLAYYIRLYPELKFSMKQKTLSKKEIGGLISTYEGEISPEEDYEKMTAIKEAIKQSYSVPILLIKNGKKLFILDGNRRARVAFSSNMGWKSIIIIPSKTYKFGIEKLAMGKISALPKS